MTWNHRMTKQTFESGEVLYAVREVYYNEEGEVEGWTEDPIPVTGESQEDLVTTLAQMLRAVVLEEPLDLDEYEDEEETPT